MNKKSAFQWGGGFEGGRKIDSGNIAGLGGVMRVLVVRGAHSLRYHLLSARAANEPPTFQQRAACANPQFFSAHKTSLFPLFYPESDFSGKKRTGCFFYFFSALLSFHLIFSPFTTHIK